MTNAECVRRYRDTHREKIAEQRKIYNLKNRKALNASHLAWKKKNIERVNEYNRAWSAEYRKNNKQNIKEWFMAWDKNTKQYKKNATLKHVYGITLEDYENMYISQEGKCITCHKFYEVLCVDHNHLTGKVRGLLCRNCNTALGVINDNIVILENMIVYLENEVSVE